MSFIKLDSKAYFNNLEILSQKVGNSNKLGVVLKDNAYGHGLEQMAKLANHFGIKKAIVRTTDEALKIKNYFENILILCDINSRFIEKNFSLTINTLHDINKIKPNTSIHLKIDTGMHRNGINIFDLEKSIQLIIKKDLKLDGIMTHFRSADEDENDFLWQLNRWKNIKQQTLQLLPKYNLKKPLFHSANSAAVLRMKKFEDDFARCGIATYGYTQIRSYQKSFKPVLSLWGEKINTIFLKKGQKVGYGGVFQATKDMVISTYDIGYGDGFFRYDGIGEFKIASKKRVLGRISMDSMSIEGDENIICLFDDAQKIAKYFNTISYDVLVKLSPSIKRVIV